ncbi:MAG: ABC transporter ATP-binding protein [Lentisphaerae bacterium]|nr:ABC transporter ATP-binding protein [Lentisphaerota bacterium]
MKKFIEAVDIHKTFHIGKHKVSVLRGASMNVNQGEWVALLGASGSGKTTLLDIIGTISHPDSGKLFIDGENMKDYFGERLVAFRRQKIGFVFQSFHLLPELSILENTMLPGLFTKTPKKALLERAEMLLEKVGLKDRIMHRPNELSGGEQQRTAIARSLINDPLLLLADEPTGNLDSRTGQTILSLFRTIHEEEKKTIIMVTHDEVVAKAADRKVILKDGLTFKDGSLS